MFDKLIDQIIILKMICSSDKINREIFMCVLETDIANTIVLQLAIITYGLLIILPGAIIAHIGFLAINGQFTPGRSEGFKFLNYSRNYRLFNQDNYWYDINRYASEKTLCAAILLALPGMAIITLSVDPMLKMYVGNPIVMLILMTAGFIVAGVLTLRYANRLITQ